MLAAYLPPWCLLPRLTIIKKARRWNVLSAHPQVSSRLENRALSVITVGLSSEFTSTLESAILTLDPSMLLTTDGSALQYRLGPNFREALATQLPGPLLLPYLLCSAHNL